MFPILDLPAELRKNVCVYLETPFSVKMACRDLCVAAREAGHEETKTTYLQMCCYSDEFYEWCRSVGAPRFSWNPEAHGLPVNQRLSRVKLYEGKDGYNRYFHEKFWSRSRGIMDDARHPNHRPPAGFWTWMPMSYQYRATSATATGILQLDFRFKIPDDATLEQYKIYNPHKKNEYMCKNRLADLIKYGIVEWTLDIVGKTNESEYSAAARAAVAAALEKQGHYTAAVPGGPPRPDFCDETYLTIVLNALAKYCEGLPDFDKDYPYLGFF